MEHYEKKIREFLNSSEVDQLYKSMLLNLFPEFRESEDERIKKELIGFLRNIPNSHYTCEEMAVWLEKQDEKKKWKPSDEQIKAVKEAACYSSVFSEKTIDNLISLSHDLKKLKG